MSSHLCQPFFFFFLLWSVESWLQAMQIKVSIPTTLASVEQHTGEEWRAMGILSFILLWRQWEDGGGTQGKHYGKTTQTVLMLGRTNPKRLQETDRRRGRKMKTGHWARQARNGRATFFQLIQGVAVADLGLFIREKNSLLHTILPFSWNLCFCSSRQPLI